VDDEEGAGARANGALDGGGIEIEGEGVDVGEDGRSADVEDGVGDGDKGERGDDDLVAFTDAEDEQGQMKAGGAGADGYGVRDGVVLGQCGFKSRQFGAEAEVRGAQDGGDGVDFGVGDVGGG
jgi:hypothetical protein